MIVPVDHIRPGLIATKAMIYAMAIETVSIHLKGIEYLSRKIPVPRWYKTRYNKLRPKLKEIMSEKDLPTLRKLALEEIKWKYSFIRKEDLKDYSRDIELFEKVVGPDFESQLIKEILKKIENGSIIIK